MPRTARIVAEGFPHHITQRGNYRQNVFDNPTDMTKYFEFISMYTNKYNVKILSYCLMNNHVHFIVIPEKTDSISKAFNRAHFRYSQYYNKKKNIKGHLWQGRFYSCVIDKDEAYLLAAMKYVERNPVRAKIAKKPWEWKWSSAGYHTGEGESDLNVAEIGEFTGINEKEWKKIIEETDKGEQIEEIRKVTGVGRGFGGEGFIKKLEKELKVTLRILKAGRPKEKK